MHCLTWLIYLSPYQSFLYPLLFFLMKNRKILNTFDILRNELKPLFTLEGKLNVVLKPCLYKTYLSFSFEDFTVCEIWQLSRTVTAGLTLVSVPDSIMSPLGRVVKERFLTDIPVEFICACVYRRFFIKKTKNSALIWLWLPTLSLKWLVVRIHFKEKPTQSLVFTTTQHMIFRDRDSFQTNFGSSSSHCKADWTISFFVLIV